MSPSLNDSQNTVICLDSCYWFAVFFVSFMNSDLSPASETLQGQCNVVCCGIFPVLYPWQTWHPVA